MGSHNTINTTSDVTVGTSPTDIVIVQANSEGELVDIEIKNTGAVALSNIILLVQENSQAAFKNRIGGTDWSTITFDYSASGGVSGNLPNTLGGGQSAWIRYRCGAAYAIKIQAQVASGNTTVAAHGAMSIRN